MNERTFEVLELNKILDQLAGYAAFSASDSVLRSLRPTPDLREARRRQEETGEARILLEERASATVGGARDVRGMVRSAQRDIPLTTGHLMELKATIEASINLKRIIQKFDRRLPRLSEIAYSLYEGRHLIREIDSIIDDHGQIRDTASPKLNEIRRELRIQHNRLQSKLQSIVSSSENAAHLQEALITTRNGRYVIPIKAGSRGRIKGVVHDQSASGATLFIEPLATVEINNRIRELELDEQEEIRRIMARITALVADEADPIYWSVEALAALDSAFAKAKFAAALRATAPKLVDFDRTRFPGSTLNLYNARHPLIDPDEVVPIDVEMDDDVSMLVVTGPNTGGKTVSLKTVGLLTLMAQCGLHIPASEESVITVFESIYADIGDEQSIEQSLSTFSAHLTHIIRILEKVDDRSLVIMDELGSGTDPTEGAAIARAILLDLQRQGATTMVATHYPDLKLFAHSTPGVRNASVEFNVETLSPTYRLIIGLPGRSNALSIATRLGLPMPIINEARSFVGQDDLQADDLLDEIHRSRDEIRQTQERLETAEAEVNALREQLRDRLYGIDRERERIIEDARREARAELDAVQREARELRKRLREVQAPPPQIRQATTATPAPSSELKEVQSEIDALADLVAETPARAPVAEVETLPSSPVRALQVGDQVFVQTLRSEGEIVAMHSGDDVEVQVGQLRVRVDADDLEWRPLRDAPPVGDDNYQTHVRVSAAASPGLELNLIGYTVEEALEAADDYLDQAYLAELPWVRIVHGHGTGKLRKAIRDMLMRHDLVADFKAAPENEGGNGVTVIYLQSL
ncbi:MAG: endonuclease MutS2 [Chloroflexi bacterium]|nr:endonuclease MutS2 [Chloroflexota bacterium]